MHRCIDLKGKDFGTPSFYYFYFESLQKRERAGKLFLEAMSNVEKVGGGGTKKID